MQNKMSAPSIINIIKRILSSDTLNISEVPEAVIMKHIVYSELLRVIISIDDFDMVLLEPDHVDELQCLIFSDEIAKRELRRVVVSILTEVIRNKVHSLDLTCCDVK